MYLEQINILLDTYAPLKTVDKCKLRFNSKPCITLGLQKSISVKNKLLTKFINRKGPILKEETHIEYKNYRKLLSTLLTKSKRAYCNKHFETNWNNCRTVASSAPNVLSHDNGSNITSPYARVKIAVGHRIFPTELIKLHK